MTLQEAISNLKIHQQWRLGADIIMIEPKELTESINVILSQLPQQEISDEEIDNAWEEFRIQNPNTVGGFQDQYESFSFAIKWYREKLKK